MGEELKCPVCSNLISQPAILPCSHKICHQCFEGILSHTAANANIRAGSNIENGTYERDVRANGRPKLSDPESGYSTASSDSTTGRMQFYGGVNDVSERGQRYELGTSPFQVPQFDPSFTCPVCKRRIHLGEPPAREGRKTPSRSRPHSLELPSVETVNDYQRTGGVDIKYCEMCEAGSSVQAMIRCEQCQVRYCEECLHQYHPPRGPLASHLLINIRQRHNSGRFRTRKMSGSHPTTPTVHELPAFDQLDDCDVIGGEQKGIRLSTCAFHPEDNMTLFCDDCSVPVCNRCVSDGRHNGHCIKPIGSVYETYKANLSRVMSGLSSKARLATNFIVQLRGIQTELQNNTRSMESAAIAKCDAIIEAVEQRKRDILQSINSEKERKYKIVRDQLQYSTMKLKRTTGLLEYCIEIMKGSDATPFLQVSPGLIQKVSATDKQWNEDELVAKSNGAINVDIDSGEVLKAIAEFNITRRGAPEKPIIKISECSAVNNTVTLSWAAPALSRIDAYILELDDGAKGPFRDVYHGKQTACTIDGLHFDSVYRARVSAYNKVGRSPCSDVVQLQTSEVAIFRMDPALSHPDIKLSQDCCTIDCKSTDLKICISNTCFSKGIHYWEYSVDRYEGSDPDIAVGVATSKVDTDFILGKDAHAWSMYVDANRTWFLHNNVHSSRLESGVQVGSRLGVLLNFQSQTVTYFVNQKQRGEPISIATSESPRQSASAKSRLIHPAVSLNKNVQLTLWTGLRPAFHGKPAESNSPANTLRRYQDNGRTGQEKFLRPNTVKMRSQSSFEMKAQPGERLYHSLPPKLVVNKPPVQHLPHTLNKRHSAMVIDIRQAHGSLASRPPLQPKPKVSPRAEEITAGGRRKGSSDCAGEAPEIRVWPEQINS